MNRLSLFSRRGLTRRKDFHPHLETLEERWLPATTVVPAPASGDSAALIAPPTNKPDQQIQQVASSGGVGFVSLPGGAPLVLTTNDANLLTPLRIAEVSTSSINNGVTPNTGGEIVVSAAILASGQTVDSPPVALNPIMAFGGGRKIPELAFPPSGGSGGGEGAGNSSRPLAEMVEKAIPRTGTEQEDTTEPQTTKPGEAELPDAPDQEPCC